MAQSQCAAQSVSSPFSRVQPGGLRVEFPFLTSFLTNLLLLSLCIALVCHYAYVTITYSLLSQRRFDLYCASMRESYHYSFTLA